MAGPGAISAVFHSVIGSILAGWWRLRTGKRVIAPRLGGGSIRRMKPMHDATKLAAGPMADSKTTVAELRERVLAFAREREWEQFHSPKNLSMALAAEAGELMEHFLWAESKASNDVARDARKRPKIEDEIADVVIYALEFANIAGIDLAAAIERKLAANAKKYPVEKSRGRADKYTDL